MRVRAWTMVDTARELTSGVSGAVKRLADFIMHEKISFFAEGNKGEIRGRGDIEGRAI